MNASADPRPPPIRHAPLAFWRLARAFLGTLHMLFGAPEDVARQHMLAHKPFLLLASWLRAGEALMRRLLIIEAAAQPRPKPSPNQLPTHAAARQKSAYRVDPDTPEAWRVAFRSFLGPPASRRHQMVPVAEHVHVETHRAGETPAVQVRAHSAWPLAERYEALIRVFDDPGGFARRLARRLFAAPERISYIAPASAQARRRIDRYHLLERASDRAGAKFFNSS